jgi:hypothetical protein
MSYPVMLSVAGEIPVLLTPDTSERVRDRIDTDRSSVTTAVRFARNIRGLENE